MFDNFQALYTILFSSITETFLIGHKNLARGLEIRGNNTKNYSTRDKAGC